MIVLDVAPRVDRYRGALLGVVVGDCHGSPFEGYSKPPTAAVVARIAETDGPLRHTDDTAQTLVLARVLRDGNGVLDPDALAHALAATWAAEPDRRYGTGAARLFHAITHDGANWQTAARELFGGEGSWGNGAAMRTIPVALVANDTAHAAHLARQQATVTHAHPHAIDGAALIATAAHLAVTGRWNPTTALSELHDAVTTRAYRDALDRIETLPPAASPRVIADRLGNGVDALSAVTAALAIALQHHDQPMAALHTALRVGGDTDTIAAMATGIVAGATGTAGLHPRAVKRCERHRDAIDLATDLASR